MVEKVMQNLRLLRLPILAGILIGTSYIPFPPWAMFFCLVPLWFYWLDSPSLKTTIWSGWLVQFILNLIGFHWIAHTAHEFGGFPWPISWLVLLGFCAIAHLYYPISGALWFIIARRFRLRAIPSVLVIVCMFGLVEWYYPMIFHWHLGYPWLWLGLPAIQTTDVIGFEGLNVLTLFINGLILIALRHRQQRKVWLSAIGSALALFVSINFWGLSHGAEWKQTDSEIKFLPIQANIGNFIKLQAEHGNFQTLIVDKYVEMSHRALIEFPDSDLLFWPETAFPGYLDTSFQNTQLVLKLQDLVRTTQKNLVVGAYSHDPPKSLADGGNNKQLFNGLFYMNQDGSTPFAPYRKTILLAYGEYFPGASLFPAWLLETFGVAEFARGSGPTVWKTPNIKLGPQICYEGLYPEFSAALAEKGAEVFVNVTNDSWFGYSFEPFQHLYMTMARALEFRRPLVRSTNTGITTAILASGEVLQQSPRHQEWYGQLKIPYRQNPSHTLYEKMVDLWVYVLIIFCILLIGFGREKPRRS